MPNIPSVEQNQWVAELFKEILRLIKDLELAKSSPSIFLVYAHDSQSNSDKKADASVAQQLTKWLDYIGATIYSDRTPEGNNHVSRKDSDFDSERSENILSSQLCLLPKQSRIACDRVDYVILCGSALLGHYLNSDYYKTIYRPGLKEAYQTAQAGGTAAVSCLADYVNLKAKEIQAGFHHVLTELGFLEIRANSEPSKHNIVTLLLNGTPAACFPEFIIKPTDIRIEEAIYRTPSHWKRQATYEDQGLHLSFFKLLERLLQNREKSTIRMIKETIYQHCLESLQETHSPDYQRKLAIHQVFEHLREEGLSRWRVESLEDSWNKTMREMLEAHSPKPKKAEQCLKEWYPNLPHRLKIQGISGKTLPMESCYINLAVVEYQPKEVAKEKEKKLKQVFYRLASAESMKNTKLKEPISLEDLFKPRRLKKGDEGVPKRILVRGRVGIGKTTLAKKSLNDYLHHGLWREHFEWVLWIPLRHLKGKEQSYPVETLLYDEYFQEHRDGWDLAQALYQKIQAAPSKTLLICDGWDEVVQERIDCLSELLNHPTVIITSRPHGVNVNEIKALDLELEGVVKLM